MTDMEIANTIDISPIIDVAKKINIKDNELELYGKYKAKINKNIKPNKKSKLILVTSINPTPLGEGKTTVLIGINDALKKLGYNSIAVLREPSLGPVFGIKGGATGGGYSQVVPSNDINMHFTGDFHAITSANNLLCSVIDNHIYQGNELNINPDKVLFNRCIDINDRILRDINLNNRHEQFYITAASEIMAILCLSKDINDLKLRLGNITVAYSINDTPIYAKELKCVDAMTILLKDAIKPNLVQTLEGNPAIIHGGPFANIAHGCNSIIATKLGLTLSDYVITEAGFGADLGAEKFFDIKCRQGLKPNCVVINFTIKALKYNGYCPKENTNDESIEYIKKGIINLDTHIENVMKFTKNIIICLNKYDTDTTKEIEFLKKYIEDKGLIFDCCESYSKGSNGSLTLARNIVKICSNTCDFKFLYNLNSSIEYKITKIIKNIYRADKVTFTSDCIDEIERIKLNGYGNLPICIAKTQYSLSNDPHILGKPNKYSITIDKIKLQSGASFIVVYLGNIMTMPGLSKNPNLEKMSINDNIIKGIF